MVNRQTLSLIFKILCLGFRIKGGQGRPCPSMLGSRKPALCVGWMPGCWAGQGMRQTWSVVVGQGTRGGKIVQADSVWEQSKMLTQNKPCATQDKKGGVCRSRWRRVEPFPEVRLGAREEPFPAHMSFGLWVLKRLPKISAGPYSFNFSI